MKTRFILILVMLQSWYGLSADEKARGSSGQTASSRLKAQRREHYILGRFVFERHCQICHGRKGDGEGEWSAGLLPLPWICFSANSSLADMSVPLGDYWEQLEANRSL